AVPLRRRELGLRRRPADKNYGTAKLSQKPLSQSDCFGQSADKNSCSTAAERTCDRFPQTRSPRVPAPELRRQRCRGIPRKDVEASPVERRLRGIDECGRRG